MLLLLGSVSAFSTAVSPRGCAEGSCVIEVSCSRRLPCFWVILLLRGLLFFSMSRDRDLLQQQQQDRQSTGVEGSLAQQPQRSSSSSLSLYADSIGIRPAASSAHCVSAITFSSVEIPSSSSSSSLLFSLRSDSSMRRSASYCCSEPTARECACGRLQVPANPCLGRRGRAPDCCCAVAIRP